MNCPQCHSPMDPVPQSSFFRRLVVGILVSESQVENSPNHRCPKCSTEVSSPIGENFVLYIENLEDYRKSCEMQAAQYRSMLKDHRLDATTLAALQTQLARVETALRILTATTLEERLHPELIGPEERHRLATQSGASPGEVDEMLKEFAEVRDFYRDYRAGKYARYAFPWWFHAAAIVPTLVAVGVGIWGAFSPAVASVLSYLGYSLICALVLLTLTRRFTFWDSSWWRRGLLVSTSGAAGVGIFVLVHDWVVHVGFGLLPLVLGCVAVVALLGSGVSRIVTGFYMRKIQHEVKVETARLVAERESSSSPVG
jgi:hypothetical protein